MVVKTNTNVKRNFVMNSSHDSDGGNDYVDGVDSLDADKFNYRWNKLDAFFDKKIRSIDAVSNNLARTGILSVPEYNANNLFSIEPFSFDISGLNIHFRMSNCCIIGSQGRNLIYPFIQFKDFMEEDNPQISIYSGSSNLHKYDRDVDGIGFYRLGHDGGEAPNVNVIARIPTLTAQAVTGLRVKFKDVISSNQVAIIKCYFNDGHSSYIQLKINTSGYTLEGSIWNGSGMTAINTLISGTRLAQTHEFCLQFLDDSVVYRLNASQGTISTVIPAQLKDVEFDHSSTSGGAEYLDYYDIEVYKRLTATVTANTTWKLTGIAVDESGNIVSTSQTGDPPANLVIPNDVCPIMSVKTYSGQGIITQYNIIDARVWKTNFNLPSGNTNYEHYYTHKNRELDIRTNAEFLDWILNKKQTGDHVRLRKGINISTPISIYNRNDIVIDAFEGGVYILFIDVGNVQGLIIKGVSMQYIQIANTCSKIEIDRCSFSSGACLFNGSYQLIHRCTFTTSSFTDQMQIKRSTSTTDSFTWFQKNRYYKGAARTPPDGFATIDVRGRFIFIEDNYFEWSCYNYMGSYDHKFFQFECYNLHISHNFIYMYGDIYMATWTIYNLYFNSTNDYVIINDNQIYTINGQTGYSIYADNTDTHWNIHNNTIITDCPDFGRSISLINAQRKILINNNTIKNVSGFGVNYCIYINTSGGADYCMANNNIYGNQGTWQKSITVVGGSVDDNNLLATGW